QGDIIQGDTQIVTVTCDRANGAAFQQALSAAHRNYAYSRIRLCVDEAHMALTDSSYRSRLRYLSRIRSELSMQVIAMTGTLAPHSEAGLQEELGLVPDGGTQVIRTQTT